MEKITLVTTVKNEEDSITAFLESALKQTRKIDEIIVVDGGSSDETIQKIEKIAQKRSYIRLLKKVGNRSVGRNEGIKKSSHNLILISDVGCILDKHWAQRLSKPFLDKEIAVVGGFYRPIVKSVFERCLATYTCTMSDQLDKRNFLPSSRSVAFRKDAWSKVGGYPENLDTCEDLVFDKKLKHSGFKFLTVSNAIVYWPQRKNIFQAAKQFFLYAKGDGKAHYFRLTTPLLYARYCVGLILFLVALITGSGTLLYICFLLFGLYLIWSIFKNYRYVKKWQAIVIFPILQIVSDIAVLSGTTIGFLKTV